MLNIYTNGTDKVPADIRGSGICVSGDRLLVKRMGGGIRSNC